MSFLERCNSMTYDNILYLADRAWREYELEYDLDSIQKQYELLKDDADKCFEFLNKSYGEILKDLVEIMLHELIEGYDYTLNDLDLDFGW